MSKKVYANSKQEKYDTLCPIGKKVGIEECKNCGFFIRNNSKKKTIQCNFCY